VTQTSGVDVDKDAQLVEAARAGDRAAFCALVVRHRPLAVRLCARVVRDPSLVEDVAQEAVLQAWLSLDKLRRPERFGAWLAGIALHVCRRWSNYRVDEAWSLEALLGGRVIRDPVDADLPPQQMVELRDLGRRVRQAIAELPVSQRSAVALFYLADLSHADVAALLGIQPGAVKTRLHKARGRLRRLLLDLWHEEHMTTEAEFLDVDVEDVRALTIADPPGERRVVLLAEHDGQRLLPVWVGVFEGDAIAIGLLRAEARRPLTHVFAAQLLNAVRARLQEVRIDRLVDETFYAQAIVESNGGTSVIDSRPSDAIALALETGAPIRVSAEVMQQGGLTRAELAEKRPAAVSARSAWDHADEIRQRVTQPRATWAVSTLF
jgi:RNA polymerase sigma factor (sigma-70 family)